jgi:hypothetical protein
MRFILSLDTWRLRGHPRKLHRFISSGLVFSATHRLILLATLHSRFTNPMRLSPLTERSHARSDRTRALYATRCSVSSPCISVAEALRWLISVSTLCSVHPSSAVRFFISLNERTFLRLEVRTSPDRGGLAEERRGVPGRPGVLNASAVRPVERSPRSMIRKTSSMALNYGAYGGMKSGSIPTESAETRTQEES